MVRMNAIAPRPDCWRWARDRILVDKCDTDFEIKKSDTETWCLADARCPAGYQCRCPTFCRKPDSGPLTVLHGAV
jgi:hypothetical protein